MVRIAVVGLLALLCTTIGLSTAPHASADAASSRAGRVTCANSYTVVGGDYWYGIASKFGVTPAALLAANSATASTPIYPGTVLCLPEGATAPTTTVPGATTTTVAGSAPVVPIAAFPIQGPCWYTDTWQAQRSGGRRHEGVDLIAKAGQYVYAVADGTLWKQAIDKPGTLSGNAWWLRIADGTYFFYAHLSAFAPDLQVGSKVVAGQVIGYVGSTGNAAAPHLHFEVHPQGGAAINPTATVKAVDGCSNTQPYPQPSGTLPPAPASTSPGGTTPPAPSSTVVSAPATSSGGLWSFISPTTAYDTAWVGSRVGAGKVTKIPISTLKGVAPTTEGVMVRLTTRGAASGGWLVVHACDAPPPFAASLTFPASGSVVGTTIVRAVGGAICLMSNVALGIKVEVIAYRAATGVGLQAIRSSRALDTRLTKRLRPGMQVPITPAELGVVPGTQALSTTVTIVDPSGAGTLSMGFCGSGPWTVPFTKDSLSSFSIAMRVTSTGWCLSSTVATDVVVDITGIWAGATGAPSSIVPTRVYDSRVVGAQVGTSPVWVQVAGQGVIPAGATTAMISISTVTGGNPGIVFLVPCGQERSVGAAAVGERQRIVTAVVPVQLGSGAVCISALQPVDVIVDVVGYA